MTTIQEKKKIKSKISAALLQGDYELLFEFIWQSAQEAARPTRYTVHLGEMPRTQFGVLAKKMKSKKNGFYNIAFDVVDCGIKDWHTPRACLEREIFDVIVSYETRARC